MARITVRYAIKPRETVWCPLRFAYRYVIIAKMALRYAVTCMTNYINTINYYFMYSVGRFTQSRAVIRYVS